MTGASKAARPVRLVPGSAPTVLRTGSPALPMGSPLRGELTWREVIGWSGFGLLLGLVAGGAGAGAVVLWLWWSA